MPGGPPSLCAETMIMSASGSGSLPAVCAQSAMRGAVVAGWRTPVSLLADCSAIMCDAPPFVSSDVERPVFGRCFSTSLETNGRGGDGRGEDGRTGDGSGATIPSSSTFSIAGRSAALRTASCSTAATAMPGRPRNASAADSLAPLVRMTWCGQSSAAAIRRLASSSAARAARPSACGEEGLAQRVMPSATAAAASGRIGVVAA